MRRSTERSSLLRVTPTHRPTVLNLRSEREINKMRAPGLLVWEAHDRISRVIQPGVTTGELDQVVEQLFDERRAVPLFKGVPGEVPFPAVTCISVNEQVVHGIPGDRVLQEGDIVSIDTGCKLEGWCGDAAVTYAVGQISDKCQHLLDVTKGVLHLAMEQMPHKSRWSEVAEEMATFVRDHGFSVVEEFVGHGIGREMHEEPEVPNFASDEFRQKGDFPLLSGLVLAVEPMVNIGRKEVHCLSDNWTQVTNDGSYSAHFEHTLALTESGVRALTGPPSEVERQEFVGLGRNHPGNVL